MGSCVKSYRLYMRGFGQSSHRISQRPVEVNPLHQVAKASIPARASTEKASTAKDSRAKASTEA